MSERNAIPDIPTRETLERAGIRILVGVLLERSLSDLAFINFWEIARRGYPLIDSPYRRADVHRNEMADVLLKSDYTHLCMLDSDHMHPSDIVERLARWFMQDSTRLVIGGLNFRRAEPFDPCIFVRCEDGKLRPPFNWPARLFQVDAMGMGSILIHRKLFETLSYPWFAYAYPERGAFPSEDMFFSNMCGARDVALWCDPSAVSPHLGQTAIHEAHFRQWVEQNTQSIKVDGQPAQFPVKALEEV